MRAAAGLLLAALLAFAGGGAAAEPLLLSVRPIERFAIGRSTTRFGDLEFLGGLDLVSLDRRFGGLSGIDVGAGGGDATMVSDEGWVVRTRLVYRDGRLAGLADAAIDRLFPGDEVSKHESDVEDIAFDPARPGRGLVVLERRASPLFAFEIGDDGAARSRSVALPRAVAQLRYNKGLESVAFAPPASPLAGRAIVIAERSVERRGGTVPGWIVGGGSFAVRRRDDFDVSSARFLPDGDLLLLERRFTPGWGIAMRLRRIDGATLRDGAVLDGPFLLEAGMTEQIDNMEGLALHRDASGRLVLTLVSDDNKSILQRTLLLQFRLVGE